MSTTSSYHYLCYSARYSLPTLLDMLLSSTQCYSLLLRMLLRTLLSTLLNMSLTATHCYSVCYSVCCSVCYSLCYSVCYSLCYSVCYSVSYPVCYSVCYRVCYSVCYSTYYCDCWTMTVYYFLAVSKLTLGQNLRLSLLTTQLVYCPGSELTPPRICYTYYENKILIE